jgi:hypothetical protein
LMNDMYGEGHDAYRPIFLPVQLVNDESVAEFSR